MTTSSKIQRSISSIGEEVGYEMGNRFVKDFQLSFPYEVPFYMIGSKILTQILSQPGCAGIKFYRALDEFGQQTLVYVGMDDKGTNLIRIVTVDNTGYFSSQHGIVADRTSRPTTEPGPMRPFPRTGGLSSDDFEWTID